MDLKIDYLKLFKSMFLDELSGVYIVQVEILLAVGALCILLPGLFLAHKSEKIRKRQALLTYLTIVYIGIVLLITIFRRPLGGKPYSVSTKLNLGNLFGNYWEVRIAFYAILNILLFVPFGFLASLFCMNIKKLKAFRFIVPIVVSFLFSLSIECIQLRTGTGIFEVTDLFNNTVGGILGTVLGVIVYGITCIII